MHPIATERLHDALGAARLIQTTVRDTTFEQYVADVWFRSATERQLMVIGEALNQARRSSPQFAAARRSVIREIPDLIDELQRILAEHGNGEE